MPLVSPSSATAGLSTSTSATTAAAHSSSYKFSSGAKTAVTTKYCGNTGSSSNVDAAAAAGAANSGNLGSCSRLSMATTPTNLTCTSSGSCSKFQNISVRPLSPHVKINTRPATALGGAGGVGGGILPNPPPATVTTTMIGSASNQHQQQQQQHHHHQHHQQKQWRHYNSALALNNSTNQQQQQQQQSFNSNSNLLFDNSGNNSNNSNSNNNSHSNNSKVTTTTSSSTTTSKRTTGTAASNINVNNLKLNSSTVTGRCLSPVIHSSQMGTENLPSPRTLYIPATRRTETTTKHIIVSTETKRKKLTNEAGAQTENRETHATQTTPDKEYEDIMLLKPIGRGLHNLEPDQQTFLRPTTPQAFARPFTPGLSGYATLDSAGNYFGAANSSFVSRSRSMQGIAGYPTMLRSPSAPLGDVPLTSPYVRQPLGAILPNNANADQGGDGGVSLVPAAGTTAGGGVNQRIIREHESEQTTTMHKEFRDGPYASRGAWTEASAALTGPNSSNFQMLTDQPHQHQQGPFVTTPGSTLPRSTVSHHNNHHSNQHTDTASSIGDHQYSAVQRIDGATATSSLQRHHQAADAQQQQQTQTSSISINHPIHVDIFSGTTTNEATTSTAQQTATVNGNTGGGELVPPPTPKFPTASSQRSFQQQQHQQQQQQQPGMPPRFVSDTSRLWYRPNISRDEAITLLKNKPAGTFLIRDSNTFKGAYGLAIKVNQLPANVQPKPGADPEAELVRHFLIERSAGGVRLKGCANEPVFPSLAALVYQHSITPLALPCLLVLPTAESNGYQNSHDSMTHHAEVAGGDLHSSSSQQVQQQQNGNSSKSLLDIGAACNVVYLGTVDCESLSGPRALGLGVTQLLKQTQPESRSTQVHFKVNSSGITLTDNIRRLFFRRHYAPASILFCGIDPEDRRFVSGNKSSSDQQQQQQIFGFVARRQPGAGTADNQCHVFAELDAGQPASAVVDFINSQLLLPPTA